MKIYILRHGEAEKYAATDFDRELTEQGEADSKNIGAFCVRAKIYFTHIFVSPLTRAKQTARLVAEQLPQAPIEETEFLTPNTDPKNLFNLLRSFTNESRILCVTHEPFASTCISALISGSENARVVMKTSTLACVETDGPPARGNGKLMWVVSSETLRHLIHN